VPDFTALVVRLSSLGDVILTTPIFENLKAAGPRGRTSVLVKRAYAPVFENNPFVDEVLIFEEKGLWGWVREIRRRRFDVVLDLHDTPRSRIWGWLSGAGRLVRYDKRAGARRRLVRTKVMSSRLAGRVVDRYLETLGELVFPVRARQPKIFVRDGDLDAGLVRRLGSGPFIGVAPGAVHAAKRWPTERFAEAADSLLMAPSPLGRSHAALLASAVGRGSPEGRGEGKVLILGSRTDRAVAEAVRGSLKSPSINLAGETSLRELFSLLSRCRVVLTNDSGIMHAADALDVPTAAVFGPTVEAFGFFPAGPRSNIVQVEGLACRPCHIHGPESCPLGHFKCMKDVTAAGVVAAAQQVLS
jgi:heptosyltransferase-2